MKVLIVNVCLRGGGHRILLPIGLGYIATAVSEAGYDLDILDIDLYRFSDEEIKAEFSSRSYDVVLMGAMVNGFKKVKAIAGIAKKYNEKAIVVAGNTVASSIIEILLQKTDVDVTVIGEGDITIVRLLDCLNKNDELKNVKGISYINDREIYHTPQRSGIENIDVLPFVNWELFDIHGYIERGKDNVNEPCPIPFEDRKILSLCVSRGCAYRCTFCYHTFKSNGYRYRSPENVISELKQMKKKYDVNFVNFWDEITFFRTEWCDRFLDLLIEADLGIHWNAACRGDLLNDDNAFLAKKMKRAGCDGLSYSLESANSKILKAMNKRLNTELISTHKRIMDEAGLASWVSIVIGYPQETEETLNETFDYCEANRIYPSAGFLLPLPKTPVYEYALKNGFVRDEEAYLLGLGDRQDLHVNMSQIPTPRLEEIVYERLMGINKSMNLGIPKESLIKTKGKKSRVG